MNFVLEYLKSLHEREPWRREAACRGMGIEAFFPHVREARTPAYDVCERCPVRRECRESSRLDPYGNGIWGGESERERKVPR